QGLTYIPFATDAGGRITYATLTQSSVAKNFTQAQLTTIFQRDTNCGTLKARVPQANSDTRELWRRMFGVPIDATHPTGFGSCVQTPETSTGVPGGIVPGCSEENNGCLLNSVGPGGTGSKSTSGTTSAASVQDPDVLFPYTVAAWVAGSTNKLAID